VKVPTLTTIAAVLLIPSLLSIPAPSHARDRATGIVLMSKRERSLDTRGKVGDAEVDSAGVKISAPGIGTAKERAAPRIPKRPPGQVGTVDRETLRAEVAQNFKDLELCRYKLAAAAEVMLPQIQAGEISLHWTILPTGHTRDTVVLELTQTDLSLMKCIRRRMNAWTFTKPVGGPLPVDFDYTFVAPEELGD
jgi:hypothetical protein